MSIDSSLYPGVQEDFLIVATQSVRALAILDQHSAMR